MPFGRVAAQVVFQGTSNLPEDIFVNTFHFLVESDPVTTADADRVQAALLSFYNTIHAPATSPLANSISDTVSRTANATTTKVYDLGEPAPRVPVKTYSWTLGTGAGSIGLPNEVALCLSYQTDIGSGDNPRTRRGRIYVGPCQSNNAVGLGGDVIPNATMIGRLTASASYLAALGDAPSPTVTWCVYSRVEDQFFAITKGWVDNAFDTQRRRGRKAQARTLWTK
jgi:hypothetical protein